MTLRARAQLLVMSGAIAVAIAPAHAQAPAPGAPAAPASLGPADRAAPRTDQNSMTAHAQLLEKARAGGIDVYFIGDSITRRWGATDYPDLLANWRQNFFGWNAGNFGWGADRTQNILWRLEQGELDGVNPKVVVIQAGTNNIGAQPGDAAKVEEITRGLTAILELCRQKAPRATVILTAIFPRNDNMAVMPEIDRVNANLARLADGRTCSIPQRQRQARRRGRAAVRRHDERAGQAASHAAGLSGVGGWPQTDPHGAAGPARLDRPRPSPDRRSERAPAVNSPMPAGREFRQRISRVWPALRG